MPLIIQKNRFLLLAALIALLLTFLHISAPLRGAGESPFFWSTHAEGVSLTTIGRWNNDLVARDGMSGEFHVLYQYLSDWIVNRVADLIGRPPFEVQAFYGAFLAGALVLVVYLSVFKFVGSAPVALVSALMVALLSDPILVDPLYLLAGESDALTPDAVFHVPAGAIALGTAQGLGYFLFIPAIISIFISQWRGSYLYAVLAGLLFGLMAQISFLTLIGLASAAGAGLALVAILHHASLEQRGVLAAKAVLLVAGSLAVALSANGNFTLVHFVVLWAILFGAGLTNLTGAAVLSVTLLSSLVVLIAGGRLTASPSSV